MKSDHDLRISYGLMCGSVMKSDHDPSGAPYRGRHVAQSDDCDLQTSALCHHRAHHRHDHHLYRLVLNCRHLSAQNQ